MFIFIFSIVHNGMLFYGGIYIDHVSQQIDCDLTTHENKKKSNHSA